MGHPISFRASNELNKKMQTWLKQNGPISQSQLLTAAVEKYISEPQVLIPVRTATNEEFDEALKHVVEEHKEALDLLK